MPYSRPKGMKSTPLKLSIPNLQLKPISQSQSIPLQSQTDIPTDTAISPTDITTPIDNNAITTPLRSTIQKTPSTASSVSSSRKNVCFTFNEDGDYHDDGDGDDDGYDGCQLQPQPPQPSLETNKSTDPTIPVTSITLPTPQSTSSTRSTRSARSSPLKRTSPMKTNHHLSLKTSAGGISKLSLNLSDILKFPRESTHAYSYAHLSPNSLAVRLSILKRSLEIFLDRPDLMDGNDTSNKSQHNSISNNKNINYISLSSPLNLDIESFINEVHQDENQPHPSPHTEDPLSSSFSKLNIRSNASSAALAALFDSATISTPTVSPTLKPTDPLNPVPSMSLDKTAHLGLKTLISILREEKLADSSFKTNKKKLAQNLHDLSLTNVIDSDSLFTHKSKESTDSFNSEYKLKIKLLHALATPFYEPIVSTPIDYFNGSSTLALSNLEAQYATASTTGAAATSTLQQPQPPQPPYIPPAPQTPTTPSVPFTTSANANSQRIFHNVSQKNTSPQAVFTVELNDPWSLKAANDLACLVFGVSRNSLRRLTLLDLISPDSRDFVLSKLIANSLTKNEIIFSGEIIAIAKKANKLTWASLWAKKKGNLIICMFDQVPCDSVDIVIDLDSMNKIMSWKKISGNTDFFKIDKGKLNHLDDLIWDFNNFLSKERAKPENENIPDTILESKAINEQRYFTITKNNIRIPCAITSKVLDENEGKLKLKIHTLPYIAGVFIVSLKDFEVLSFNQSISKNLFGLNESSLINQPITKIIPNFVEIITFVQKRAPNLKFVPGLILPEHFFRQMNALLKNSQDSTFLNSIGLEGKHVNGSTIYIDIQLRCSSSDTVALWITHSRNVYANRLDGSTKKVRIKVDNDLGTPKTPSNTNNNNLTASPTLSTPTGSNTHNNLSTPNNYTPATSVDSGLDEDDEEGRELPSQLSILDENEIRTVSRSSSIRSTVNSSPDSSSSVSPSSSSKHSTVDVKSLTDHHKRDTVTSQSNQSPSQDLSNFKVLDSNMDESKLLKLENETIEKQKSISSHYPKTIGIKRRQKSYSEFKILKKMGQGAYGRVVLAENKEDPNYVVVIKLIIKERILVDTWVRDRKLGTIPSEIQIMATLNNQPHPNIMRLIDFFEDDEFYYIETPQHGFPSPAIDLFDMIELRKSMSEYEIKSITRQCISAVNHLHKNGVVHRDIKDENLIIDSNGVIKLIDFGSSAYIKQGPFDVFVGTLDYAAPEVLNGQSYEGAPQDVWSLGILLYTLVYKENPFYNVDEIMEGELNVPFVLSEGSLKLIRKILQRDVKKRPKMEELVGDPWLND